MNDDNVQSSKRTKHVPPAKYIPPAWQATYNEALACPTCFKLPVSEVILLLEHLGRVCHLRDELAEILSDDKMFALENEHCAVLLLDVQTQVNEEKEQGD